MKACSSKKKKEAPDQPVSEKKDSSTSVSGTTPEAYNDKGVIYVGNTTVRNKTFNISLESAD